MIDRLLEPLLSSIGSRINRYATGPVLLFWVAGTLLFLNSGSGLPDCGDTTWVWCRVPAGPWRIAVAAALGVAAILISAVVSSFLAQWLTRFLCATPISIGPLASWHARRRSHYIERLAITESSRRSAAIWQRARRYPAGPLRPFWTSNALAATHQRMQRRYGLDLSLCWSLLLQSAPDSVQERLEKQMALIVSRAQGLLLAAVAIVWFPFLDEAYRLGWIAACIVTILVFYAVMRQATAVLCDAIEEVTTLHRGALYDGLGLARPLSTADEPALGAAISAYLRHADGADLPLNWRSPA